MVVLLFCVEVCNSIYFAYTKSSMKAILFAEHGGPDQLRLGDIEEPEPGPGEVKIRVRAVALNGFDPMMLAGSTGLRVPLPMVPCGDFAGDVVAVGARGGSEAGAGAGAGSESARETGARTSGDTSEDAGARANDDEAESAGAAPRPGDRVTGYPILPGAGMMGEVVRGAACEYVCIPAACALRMPDGLSYEHGAALPVAYGTAYRMMGVRGRVKRGERVLILGATGGVGVGCVQLAKNAGAEVVACGGGEWKLERLREIGADHTIDTSRESFRAAVRERFGKPAYDGSGDGGVDVVVNYIGGDTWADGLKVARRHGRILVCGATAGHAPQTDLRYLWSFEQTVIGSNGWTIEDQRELMSLAAAGELEPVIHAVRPLRELPDAMQELIDRRVFGKSVIRV